MNGFLAMILGCFGGGVYAIVKRTLPIGSRRKVIDAPAIRLGIALIALPILNAAVLFCSRWAAAYFPDSKSIAHWSLMAPLIMFPLSIAGCLAISKRWSVPKHYTGDWLGYTPYKREDHSPDLSFLGTAGTEPDDGG